MTQRDGILVGEVSESEGSGIRKRRLYATAGEYAIAEVTGFRIRLTGTGGAGSFVVLGNQITKEIARTCIQETWKEGTIDDAIRIIMFIMERASDATASVSAWYNLIQTPAGIGLSRIIEKDAGD